MNAPIRRIEYAGDEPEEFTQGEALTKCESALYFLIGAAAVAAVLFVAVQVWPLIPLMAAALN